MSYTLLKLKNVDPVKAERIVKAIDLNEGFIMFQPDAMNGGQQ